MDLKAGRLKMLKRVNDTEPLVSIHYNGKEKVMAYRNIRWNPDTQSLIYTLYEPQILENERELLRQGQRTLTGHDYRKMVKRFNRFLDKRGYRTRRVQKIKMHYYIYRDVIGLGPIEPLVRDSEIKLIECEGPGFPVLVGHKDIGYGTMETNLMFKNRRQFDWFINKLKSSVDPSFRFETNGGFKIIKFTRKPTTTADLVNEGVASPEILAYMWYLLENGRSVVVGGSSSSGKTEFINAIASFIRPEASVISIEDKPQLRLPHPNWKTKVSNNRFGAATSALEERPGCLVFDNIGDDEIYVMLQAAKVGYPALASLHADSIPDLLSKFMKMGHLSENLDLIVFMIVTKKGGEYVRRVSEVIEVVGYDRDKKEMVTNTVFRWNPAADNFNLLKSVFLRKFEGGSLSNIKRAMEFRTKFIASLKKGSPIDIALKIAKFRRRSRSQLPVV